MLQDHIYLIAWLSVPHWLLGSIMIGGTYYAEDLVDTTEAPWHQQLFEIPLWIGTSMWGMNITPFKKWVIQGGGLLATLPLLTYISNIFVQCPIELRLAHTTGHDYQMNVRRDMRIAVANAITFGGTPTREDRTRFLTLLGKAAADAAATSTNGLRRLPDLKQQSYLHQTLAFIGDLTTTFNTRTREILHWQWIFVQKTCLLLFRTFLWLLSLGTQKTLMSILVFPFKAITILTQIILQKTMRIISALYTRYDNYRHPKPRRWSRTRINIQRMTMHTSPSHGTYRPPYIWEQFLIDTLYRLEQQQHILLYLMEQGEDYTTIDLKEKW